MSDLNLDESPKITGAPAEIWLCYGDVFETQAHADLNNQGVVLWCEEKQDHADIRYVRADAVEAKDKLIAELEYQLKHAQQYAP